MSSLGQEGELLLRELRWPQAIPVCLAFVPSASVHDPRKRSKCSFVTMCKVRPGVLRACWWTLRHLSSCCFSLFLLQSFFIPCWPMLDWQLSCILSPLLCMILLLDQPDPSSLHSWVMPLWTSRSVVHCVSWRCFYLDAVGRNKQHIGWRWAWIQLFSFSVSCCCCAAHSAALNGF